MLEIIRVKITLINLLSNSFYFNINCIINSNAGVFIPRFGRSLVQVETRS